MRIVGVIGVIAGVGMVAVTLVDVGVLAEVRANLAILESCPGPHDFQEIDDGKVGPVTSAESDCVGDGARDATYLVAVLDQDLLGHICDREVVFRN